MKQNEVRDEETPRRRTVVFCSALSIALLLGTGPFYSRGGLSIAWLTTVPLVVMLAMLFALWRYHARDIRSETDAAVTDAIAVTCLMLAMFSVASPAQYLAVSLNRPLTDAWLARADELLGIHVASLAAWTRVHPFALYGSYVAYSSFVPQLIAAIVLLGIVYRRRDRLWEYCFHFHFCLVVTLAVFAVYPAASIFQYDRFAPTIDEAGFITQFNALRAGTFHVIRFGTLEGFVSMPSFHAVGGLIVTWAFRGQGPVFLTIALLNVLMLVSTVVTGAHYAVDVVGAAVLFGVSVGVHRWVILSR